MYSTLYLGGGNSWTNTVYVDADAGPQGAIMTPGLEAIQETQVLTTNADAELGDTGGGVLLFELKSGTNKPHDSAFEFLQNEALNANSWQNNCFLAGCKPRDVTCNRNNSRPRGRATAFNWGYGYPGQTQYLARNISQTSFGYDNPLSISPKTLHLGCAQNFYAGIQYELSKDLILDVRYMGSKGSALHDTPESIGQNYPDFNTYSRLLTSGHINDTISSPSQAAADGVPYPYAGFIGPASTGNAITLPPA